MHPWSDLVSVATMVAVGVSVAQFRLARMRVRSVVQTLALIVGQNIPLSKGLRAAAQHEEQKLRRIYEGLARRLEAGAVLSEALKLSCRACSGHVLGAIQAGELGGTLPSVLRSLAADLQRERESVARFAPAAAYFFTLAVVVPTILLMIAVFLLPEFRMIFVDFGVEPHPLHDQMSAVADFIVRFSPILIAALLGLAMLTLYAVFGQPFFRRLPDRVQRLAAFVDTIIWHMPLLRKIAETRALARQLPIMQAAIRAGADLAPAARQAACVDTNFYARRRMRRWAEQIEAGGDPRSTARTLGFTSALRSALTTARGPDELAAALDYLCSYYRSLLIHWEQIFVSAAIPVMVLTWGVCVAFIALALFVPLYAILDSLMDGVF